MQEHQKYLTPRTYTLWRAAARLSSSAFLAGMIGLGMTGCERGAEAVVNGEPVETAELENALKIDRGQVILQRLIIERAIAQDAKKQGITIDDRELKPYRAQIGSRFQDVGMRKVIEQDLRARLLLRKVLLKDVSEARRHKLYDLFQDELKEYDLYAAVTKTRPDAEKVIDGLDKAFSFETLSDTYETQTPLKRIHGHIGFLTRAGVQNIFGETGATVVEGLDEKGFSKQPLTIPNRGFLILRIDSIRSSYTDLRGKIEDLIVAANGPAYLHSLSQNAKVSVLGSMNGMASTNLLEENLSRPFKEEPPPTVDLSAATPAPLGDTVGSRVGAALGLGVPNPRTNAPVGDAKVGADVGADLGLGVPSVAIPAASTPTPAADKSTHPSSPVPVSVPAAPTK
jgi:hypothetical protein